MRQKLKKNCRNCCADITQLAGVLTAVFGGVATFAGYAVVSFSQLFDNAVGSVAGKNISLSGDSNLDGNITTIFNSDAATSMSMNFSHNEQHGYNSTIPADFASIPKNLLHAIGPTLICAGTLFVFTGTSVYGLGEDFKEERKFDFKKHTKRGAAFACVVNGGGLLLLGSTNLLANFGIDRIPFMSPKYSAKIGGAFNESRSGTQDIILGEGARFSAPYVSNSSFAFDANAILSIEQIVGNGACRYNSILASECFPSKLKMSNLNAGLAFPGGVLLVFGGVKMLQWSNEKKQEPQEGQELRDISHVDRLSKEQGVVARDV